MSVLFVDMSSLMSSLSDQYASTCKVMIDNFYNRVLLYAMSEGLTELGRNIKPNNIAFKQFVWSTVAAKEYLYDFQWI